MVYRSNDCCRHLGNAGSNRFSLRGHHHNLRTDLDVLLEAQHSRDHELRPIANCIHRTVLHHNPGIIAEDQLKRHDHPTQVFLIPHVIVHVLRIQNIMHRGHVLVLVEDTGSITAKLLHVRADTEHEAEMDAEGSDVGTSLAGGPQYRHLSFGVVFNKLGLVDGTYAQLPLHCRDDGRPLETCSGQLVKRLLNLRSTANVRVESDNCNVLFAR
mmetsp:Transcript_13280/g.24991  ORF Transcript_13280/g.24991 Transcript_13280/m.24991 type:complete len:213 (+) Transcript_13280:446-1084(+)